MDIMQFLQFLTQGRQQQAPQAPQTPQAGLADKVGVRSFGSSDPYQAGANYSPQQAAMLNEQEAGLTMPDRNQLLAGLLAGGRSGPVYQGPNITQSDGWEFFHNQ